MRRLGLFLRVVAGDGPLGHGCACAGPWFCRSYLAQSCETVATGRVRPRFRFAAKQFAVFGRFSLCRDTQPCRANGVFCGFFAAERPFVQNTGPRARRSAPSRPGELWCSPLARGMVMRRRQHTAADDAGPRPRVLAPYQYNQERQAVGKNRLKGARRTNERETSGAVRSRRCRRRRRPQQQPRATSSSVLSRARPPTA